jgi:hypothetical protein
MNSSAVLEFLPTTSHCVVESQQRIIVIADGADVVMVDGVMLPMLLHPMVHWIWYVDRTHGWHQVTVIWPETTTTVMVECISDSTHRQFVTKLYAELRSVDERLCAGNATIRQVSCDRSTFESLIGASSVTCLAQILDTLGSPHRVTRDVWNGASLNGVRFDQVIFDGATLLPVQYTPESVFSVSDIQVLLEEVLQDFVTFSDAQIDRLVEDCRDVLTRLTRVSSQAHALLTMVVTALRRSRHPNPGSLYTRTVDVALLYERWVWIQSLLAFDVEHAHIRAMLDDSSSNAYAVTSNTWCGYQRRLTTTYSPFGWSRDGRVAIPDVLLWQQNADESYRALVIDAKCSLMSTRLGADALNDGTAYLRRIGIGNQNPDAVILVHPGTAHAVWPSGLITLGTDGIDSVMLREFIRRWLHHEPFV